MIVPWYITFSCIPAYLSTGNSVEYTMITHFPILLSLKFLHALHDLVQDSRKVLVTCTLYRDTLQKTFFLFPRIISRHYAKLHVVEIITTSKFNKVLSDNL